MINQVEHKMLELNNQFSEFIKLKGLSNEYKVEIVETK